MPLNLKVLISSCALTLSAVLVAKAEKPIVQLVNDTECASCVDDTVCDCCEPPLIPFNTAWCCPGWAFTADVLILNRSDAPSQTLATDQNTGAEILNAENLDFDAAGAMRYRLVWQDICCNGWEAGYFGLDSWNASDRTDGNLSPLFQGPGIPIGSTQPGTVFQTDYGTDLDSFELNRRIGHRSWLTFVHGFRWLHLREQLRVSQVAPVSRDLFTVDTDNQMYGYQVGFDSLLYTRSNFQFDVQVRSAILYNNADTSTQAPFLTGVPGFVDSLTASDDHTAFFGGLGLNGSYWLGRSWAVRAGYNLMWLEGVALAPPQIPVNNLVAPGTSGIDTGTGLFFHGASVGLVATW